MLVDSDVSYTVSYKGLILPILFTRSEIVSFQICFFSTDPVQRQYRALQNNA